MKVLVLTHHQTFPSRNGASQRIQQCALELSRCGVQVTLISLVSPRTQIRSYREITRELRVLEFRNFLQWSDGIGKYVGFPDYSLTSHLNKFFPLKILTSQKFDVIISESPFLWKLARRFEAGLYVLSAHNWETGYHSHYSDWQKVFIEKVERLAVSEADLVVAVTEEDKLKLQEIRSGARILAIPNGFSENEYLGSRPQETLRSKSKQKLGIPENHRVALMLASQSPHNFQGLKELMTQVQENPPSGWTFAVVGNIQPLRLKGSSPFIFYGFQKDLKLFWESSELALNPVVSGSGSNVKLIDCLGHGLPVLTTEYGARGLSSHLRGVYAASLMDFPELIKTKTDWELPCPKQLRDYQWSYLGEKYFDILSSSLKEKEEEKSELQ